MSRVEFGIDIRRKLTGADLYVGIFQIFSLLPLPYMFLARVHPPVYSTRNLFSVLFDTGICALPRLEAYALSCLYRMTSSEVAVYFVILAIALLIGTIQGDPHIVGIILSIVAAVIFACITKFVWKHYRGSINSFKRKRVTKLQEDHVNDERAKNDAKNIDSKNNTISEYEGNIEFLKKGIEEINGYLAIDRSKRISYFTKQHWDAAGIDNSIVIDEAIVRFHEIEKDYKVYPGYKSVSKLS